GGGAVESEIARQGMAADLDEGAVAVEFAFGGWCAEDLADVRVLGQCDLDIGDDFGARVIDLEHGQLRQCGIEQQRWHRELRADGVGAAPLDRALAILVCEREVAADGDVGAVEQFLYSFPDSNDATGVLDAVDEVEIAGELSELEFGHAGM